MARGGTYALVIALEADIRLEIGELGEYELPRGYYVYVGSALGGVEGRLRRHLRAERRLHWHIDYLLQRARVIEAWYSYGQRRLECLWNGVVGTLPGATRPIAGYGASDCTCPAHHTHIPTPPSFELFEGKLKGMGIAVIRSVLA